jgi:hypothetical protein
LWGRGWGPHIIKVSIFAFEMLYESSLREKYVNFSKYSAYLTRKYEVVTSTTPYFTKKTAVCYNCHFCSGLNGGSGHAHHLPSTNKL